MAYLTRSDILGADDLERREVEVPEWGGTVLVRALTGAERGQIEANALEQHGTSVRFKPKSLEAARAQMVVMAAINEDGTRVFTMADIRALGKKSGEALDRVVDVVTEISAIKGGALDELAASFEPGPNADSGSD